MFEITVKCFRCGKEHGLSALNAKLLGPVVHVWCPFCRKKTVRNLSKFVEKQIPTHRNIGRFELFSIMVGKAKIIEKRLTP